MKQAKIFLADERGVTETEWFRSYNTFNFGEYMTEYKTPVESLYVCNDDTLDGGHGFSYVVNETTQILMLPVVGAVEFAKNNEEEFLINAGEVFSIDLSAGDAFTITNPYKNELVNFLHFWVKAEETTTPHMQLHNFNIDEYRNKLIPLSVHMTAHVVKLNGRKEVVYRPCNANSCVFAFTVQGAFEMEGILLHARDGVAFWNYEQAEIEALSNDAIIVLLEMKLD